MTSNESSNVNRYNIYNDARCSESGLPYILCSISGHQGKSGRAKKFLRKEVMFPRRVPRNELASKNKSVLPNHRSIT